MALIYGAHPFGFLQSRAAWGETDNRVRPFMTFTDNFSTKRWLVSATLSGRWTHGPWSFNPSTSFTYLEDNAASFIDPLGVAAPAVKTQLGQFKAGPEIGYAYQAGNGLTLEPRAGLMVVWDFVHETAAGLGQIDGEPAGAIGVRGRVELGLRATSAAGVGVDLSGAYDGLGASSYSAVSGRANVRIPFQ